MPTTAALAETAALFGDPARASMLTALLDGRALTAGELACAAGITPQTASGHLARLTQAGLLALERQGRHRYHRLASPAVAQLMESLMVVAAGNTVRCVTTGPRDRAMKRARTCYDHLAGELAVAMADRMVEREEVEWSADGGVLTPAGIGFLRGLGVDLDAAAARATKHGPVFCRPCLDWSERRPHIAGAVGAALCTCCLDRGWVRRMPGTRAVQITIAGMPALERAFDLRPCQDTIAASTTGWGGTSRRAAPMSPVSNRRPASNTLP